MSQKSIKKNYFYNLLYQILILITPVITTPYISRVLEADGIGISSFTQSIVSYFVLFATLGLTVFGQREISYVRENKEKRTQVFWETKFLAILSASIVAICYILFAFSQENRLLYFVLIFNILSVIADVTWFFQGLEEFGRIVLRNAIFKIISIAYVFLAIHSKDDLIWYLFGISFIDFLSNVSLWFYLPRFVGRPDFNKIKPLRHFKVVISLFIPTIAIRVYTVLDKTMIGIITSNAYENGFYEQAHKIISLVLTLVTSLGAVTIPRIGFYFEQKMYNDVKSLMYRSYRFAWFLGMPICCGLIMVSDSFVPWFFGPGYGQVSTLLKILAFLILAIGINNVTGMQYLIPTKQENLFTASVVIGAATNFLLNIFLIYLFQSCGAAIASVMAESAIAIVQLYFVRKEISPKRVVLEGMPYFFAAAVMTLVLWLYPFRLEATIINSAFMVAIGAVVYFTVLLLIRDEFFISNVTTVLNGVVGKVRKSKK